MKRINYKRKTNYSCDVCHIGFNLEMDEFDPDLAVHRSRYTDLCMECEKHICFICFKVPKYIPTTYCCYNCSVTTEYSIRLDKILGLPIDVLQVILFFIYPGVPTYYFPRITKKSKYKQNNIITKLSKKDVHIFIG
jgi:hypothetical protein